MAIYLFRLDARKLDDLAPFLDLFGDQFAEVGARAREQLLGAPVEQFSRRATNRR